ncbi:MAG: cytochrome c family protein [Magnetococcus sp. WYHC-3]
MSKTLLAAVVAAFAVSAFSGPVLAGDVEAGKKLFAKCFACHDNTDQKKKKTGPPLWGVVGRGIAEMEGFPYSDAFKGKKGTMVWDEANIDAYLTSPKDFVPKNKMAFVGLKDAGERANVIEYLKTLK